MWIVGSYGRTALAAHDAVLQFHKSSSFDVMFPRQFENRFIVCIFGDLESFQIVGGSYSEGPHMTSA